MTKKKKLGAIALASAVGAALATAGYIRQWGPVQAPVQALAGATLNTTARAADYGRIPISFEPNRGQSGGNMAFIARGPGFSLGLNAEGATVRLNRPGVRDVASPTATATPRADDAVKTTPSTDAALELRLVSANENPVMVAENKLPGVSHYPDQTGSSGPLTNIPHYGAVRYHQVYPGVDWLLYGNPMKLEYDFIVAPQADPSRIRIRIDGADSLALDETGALLVTVAGQTVRQDKPLVYQQSEGRRTTIDARYQLSQPSGSGATEIAFVVADYDHAQALVIDPVLVYSTYLGGSGDDSISALAVDSTGSVFVAGTTSSIDFPATPMTEIRPQAFISKLNATGDRLEFSTFLGKAGSPASVAIAESGVIYFSGLDFLPEIPTSSSRSTVCSTGYSASLNAAGTVLLTAKCLPFLSPIFPGPNQTVSYPPPKEIAINALGTIFRVDRRTITTEDKNQDILLTEETFNITKIHNSGNLSSRPLTKVTNGRDQSGPRKTFDRVSISKIETNLADEAYIAYTKCSEDLSNNENSRSSAFVAKLSSELGNVISIDDSGRFGGLYCDRKIAIGPGQDDNAYSVIQSVDPDSVPGQVSYPTKIYNSSGNVIGSLTLPKYVSSIATNVSGIVHLYDGSSVLKMNGARNEIVEQQQLNDGFLIQAVGRDDVVAAGSTTDVSVRTGYQPTNAGGRDLSISRIAFSGCIDRSGTISLNSSNMNAREGGASLLLGVTRSGVTEATCSASVRFVTADGSATAGSDYQATSGLLTWGPGENSTKTITIPIVNDSAFELGEFASINLSEANGSALGSINSAVFNITDNDLQPSVRISVSTNSIPEVNGSAVVTATLSAAAGTPVTVPLVYSGTATRNADYTAPDQIVINPGRLTGSMTIFSVDNTLPESEENLVVTIGTPISATRGSPDSLTVFIRDNDSAAGVSFSPTTLAFGNQALGSTSAPQAVVLTNSGTNPLTISFIGASGDFNATPDCPTALAVGASCNIVTRFVPSAVGPRSGAITVMSNAPTSPDTVTLSGTGIDSGRLLSIADVSITEGNSGTSLANVTVSLSSPSTEQVSVRLTTSDNTAIAGSDYVSRKGVISFAPGQTSRVIPITINGDTTIEPDESFFVTMSEPAGAAIGDGQGVVTIVNDDATAAPMLNINDVSTTEGNAGIKNLTFTISLSPAATGTVTVAVATANGTASSGSDFNGGALTVTFAAGETIKAVSLGVRGDTLVEPDETFFVNLSNATGGATIADSQGIGTIVNDDGAATPTLSINDVSATEGNSGATNFAFTVSLSPAAATAVTVTAATSNGTAVSGSDFNGGSLSVSFAAGETSRIVNVGVRGDTVVEPNETFFVNLSNPTGGAVIGDGQGLGTIQNDDGAAAPTVSIGDATSAEGNSGTKSFSFVVTLSAASTVPVSVIATTANGTAIAGSDYTGGSLTLNFAPGQTIATASLPVRGDTVVEPNETFFVNLSNPTGGAVIGDGQGLGTIQNDD